MFKTYRDAHQPVARESTGQRLFIEPKMSAGRRMTDERFGPAQ